MSNTLPIEDLSKTYLEHSMVIHKQPKRLKEYFFYQYSTLCDGSLIQCHRRI